MITRYKLQSKEEKIFYVKPKALKMELLPEEVDVNRKFDCIFYNNCLDHSAYFYYESFSCKDCNNYHKHKINYNTENCINLLNHLMDKRKNKEN